MQVRVKAGMWQRTSLKRTQHGGTEQQRKHRGMICAYIKGDADGMWAFAAAVVVLHLSWMRCHLAVVLRPSEVV